MDKIVASAELRALISDSPELAAHPAMEALLGFVECEEACRDGLMRSTASVSWAILSNKDHFILYCVSAHSMSCARLDLMLVIFASTRRILLHDSNTHVLWCDLETVEATMRFKIEIV